MRNPPYRKIIPSLLAIIVIAWISFAPFPVGASVAGIVIEALSTAIGGILLKIASLINYLGGLALNYSLWYTVVNMAQHYGNIPTIDSTWSTVRDVANMGFIFVLLYASIKTILGIGSDVRRLIVNMIVAAVLINFSLFITKVIIDASNVLAVFFYSAISPAATAATASGGFNYASGGLSDAFTSLLNLQTLYQIGGGGRA